jgi:hypothetical protein
MAERLEKNADEPFGGAFVAVPPEGDSVEILTISDNKQNMGQFWGTVTAHAGAAIREAEELSRRMRGFAG